MELNKMLKERMKKVKAIDPYSKEGQNLQNQSRKKYGAWWLFTDNTMQKQNCDNWIMQFYVGDDRRKK